MKICHLPLVIFRTTSQFFFYFRSNIIVTNQSRNWPNSCHFWNKKSVFLQILHHSSVLWLWSNGCEIFAKQKNVFLVTLKILHIVVTTALKKIYIYNEWWKTLVYNLKCHACCNHQVYILILISKKQRKYILQ